MRVPIPCWFSSCPKTRNKQKSLSGREFMQLPVQSTHSGLAIPPAGLTAVINLITSIHYSCPGAQNLCYQPLDGSPAPAGHSFPDSDIFDFFWSTDGKQLAVTRLRTRRTLSGSEVLIRVAGSIVR
jgi:hypothetical protein